MKIDLHIHTQVNKKGEPQSRIIISPEDFYKKMVQNDIGIASITNHTIFDKKEYECILKIFKNNKVDFLLLPGVEIDIFIDKNNKKIMKQMNLIFSNNENLDNICSLIDEYNKTGKNIEDFLKIFQKEQNVIFYVDYKRHEKNNKWWDYEEVQTYLLENKVNAPIIYDSPNARTHFVLQAKNINSLIGTDIQNWCEYDNKSKNLIDINMKINSFENFVKIIKYDPKTLNDLIKTRDKQKFTNLEYYKQAQKNENVNISGEFIVYNGLNVIFGPKSSGKSSILKAIYQSNKQTSVIYESSRLSNEYDNFINKWQLPNNEINMDEVKLIKNILDEIKKYDDKNNFNIIHNIKQKIDNPSNINFSKSISLKTQNIIFKNSEEQEIKFLKELFLKVKNIIDFIDRSNFEITNKYLNNEELSNLNLLKNKIFDKFIEINKEKWKIEFFEKMYKEINSTILKSTGKTMFIKNNVLFDKWNKRVEIIKKIKLLKQIKYIKNDFFIHKKLDIKSRKEEINIATKISYLNFNDFTKSKEYLLKIKNGSIDKIKILNKGFSQDNWIKPIEFDETFKEIISDILIDFTNNFIKTENLVINNFKEIIDLSNGEKALLILFNLLDSVDNEKYILLDEPDVFLSPENIVNDLIPKINEFKMLDKYILLTTHNSSLGINSIPFNMIYREKKNENTYVTALGNPWINEFIYQDGEETRKSFSEVLINKFEGGKKHFNFRKNIYYDDKK